MSCCCYLFSLLMTFKCIICMEKKSKTEEYELGSCNHRICRDCASQHAEVQVRLGRIHVPCPWVGCGKSLLYKECEELLCEESMNILQNRIKESEIPVANRVYCTYVDCWGLRDSRELELGASLVQCTSCSRFFRNVQIDPDEQVVQLAKFKQWRECPECKNMIELSDGCEHVVCRCGAAFCYKCGEIKRSKLILGVIHGSCRNCGL